MSDRAAGPEQSDGRNSRGGLGLATLLLLVLSGLLSLGLWSRGSRDRGAAAPDPAEPSRHELLLPMTGSDTVWHHAPVDSFAGASGSGNVYVEVINIPVASGRVYKMRIINGNEAGEHRVTGGAVYWNGLKRETLGSGFFTIHEINAATPIDTLKVEAIGPAGSFLRVQVFSVTSDEFTVFGENTYDIPSGSSKSYAPTFQWSTQMQPPYRIYVFNGDTLGNNRVSSAQIKINGTTLYSTSDLTSAVGSATRSAFTLNDGTNTLSITLNGSAGKYIKIRITATDTTTPALTVTAPADSTTTNQASVPVTGTISDVLPTGVTINGVAASVTNNTSFAGDAALNEGWNTIAVVATDAIPKSQTVTLAVRRDSQAPLLTVLAPTDSTYTKNASVAVSGTVIDATPVQVVTNGTGLTVGGTDFSGNVSLTYGANTLVTTATDLASNQSVDARMVFFDTLPPLLTVTSPADGSGTSQDSVAVSGTVSDASPVTVTVNGLNAPVVSGSFSRKVPVAIGPKPITTVAIDHAGNSSSDNRTVNRESGLPPDPATVANVVNRAEVTTIADNTSFLYSGPAAVQTGVIPGTILPVRAAVVRGRVLTQALQPLSGVQVEVLGDTALGRTLTRAGDGGYDMAVNGGSRLTLSYTKAGYLPASRTVQVRWQDYTNVDDVILLQPDTAAAVVDLTSAAPPVARASVVTDADGPRQATVIVKPGNSATLHNPDGTTQPLTSLTVRATEFTVGDSGHLAMPAPLPPASQYTYAVSVTADEAGPGGEVTLAQPVPLYVENFLDFPVGTPIPLGRLDPSTGTWVAEPNGRVIKIVGKDSTGRALVDITGDDVADPPNVLFTLGLDDYELDQLGATYPAGADLWRSLIQRMAVYDENLPYIQVGTPPVDGKVKAGCGSREGDLLRCQLQVQTAFQTVGLVGSPFTLNYASDRTQGNKADRTLDITLTGATLPNQLQRVELEIDVAGRRIRGSFPSPTPNMTYTFQWDGMDIYGRLVQGSVPATVLIGYVFPVFYAVPANSPQAFGLPCLPPSGSTAACALLNDAQSGPRTEQVLAQAIETSIGGLDATALGLGGFTLSAQHVYDPIGQVLYRGDGTRRATAALPPSITTVAGTGTGVQFPSLPIHNDTAATKENIGAPEGIAVGPDGSFYFTDRGFMVRKVTPDGLIHTLVGSPTTQSGDSGDGGPASGAQLTTARSLALGPDGSLYIADGFSSRIRKIDPNGIITTVAGNGTAGFSGDSGLATSAKLSNPTGVDVAADGTLYIADQNNHRIRRVGTDGIITTVAGNGQHCFGATGTEANFVSLCGEDTVATHAKFSVGRLDVRVGPNGVLYITDEFNNRVRTVTPDGKIHTFAGSNNTPLGDGGPAVIASVVRPQRVAIARDGTVYISQFESNADTNIFRIRRVAPSGIITTFAGTGTTGYSGDGGPAAAAKISEAHGLALGPDGSLYLSDRNNNRVRRIRGVLPAFGAGQTVIASQDGVELYVFSAAGRHLLTLDAASRDTLLLLAYDSTLRVISVTDRHGATTVLQRDLSGQVTGIVTPDGVSSQLARAGDTLSVTPPGGASLRLVLDSVGQLRGIVDERGQGTSYSYDTQGLLTGITGAGGQALGLSQSTLAEGSQVSTTSPAGLTEVWTSIADADGSLQIGVTDAAGLQSHLVNRVDGTTVSTEPDGSTETSAQYPHPLYGMQAPLTSTTLLLPSGLTSTSRTGAALTLDSQGNILTQQDSAIVNGRVTVGLFDRIQGAATITLPSGRTRLASLDAQGRVSVDSVPGLAGTHYAYDAEGRVLSVTAGSRSWNYSYDLLGRVTSTVGPSGDAWRFGYDTDGRVTTDIRPGNDSTRYTFDPAGNATSITTPRGTVHRFTYSPEGLALSYEPPDVGDGALPLRHAYGPDGRLLALIRGSGDTVAFLYDSAGRVSGRRTTDDTTTIQYDATTGRPAAYASTSGVSLTLTHDGPLPLTSTWSGPVAGSVATTYDADHRVVAEAVNGAQNVAYGYDADGQLQSAGGLTLTRHPVTGLTSSLALGALLTSLAYDSLAAMTALTVSFGGGNLFQQQFARDAAGRVTNITETVGGSTTVFGFGYDSAGRLSTVTRDGLADAAYQYDRNGNMVQAVTGQGIQVGLYDAQDRLLAFGTDSFGYTQDGTLRFRVAGGDTTWYSYSAAGPLLGVTRPDGTTIDYLLDPVDRRIGKKVNGQLVRGWLYAGGLTPVAELDGQGQVVSRFVYGRFPNVPEYMIKGGVEYRLVTDRVGSVRLVVDAQTGAVAQRLDYDAFGRVVLNTNPGFQPFGFGGGLYDEETGLVKLGARDYDGSTGRWTSRDPLLFRGGQVNLYVYAGNDPVQGYDPTGEFNLADLQISQKEGEKLDDVQRQKLTQKLSQLYGRICSLADKAAENAGRLEAVLGISHRHHAAPQGVFRNQFTPNVDEFIVRVYAKLHLSVLHPLIDVALKINGMPRLAGGWGSADPAERARAAQAILRASEAFDRGCETRATNYRPVAPELRRFMELAGIPLPPPLP